MRDSTDKVDICAEIHCDAKDKCLYQLLIKCRCFKLFTAIKGIFKRCIGMSKNKSRP